MKKITAIMAAFILVLTGCANEKAETAPAQAQTAVPADSSQLSAAEPQGQTTEYVPEPDDSMTAAAQGGEAAVVPPDFEAPASPPELTVSTLNNADRITISCTNSQWSHMLPDGTASSVNICGAHPLDQQEYPVLYTAFPAGSLPPVEDGATLGSILPVFYLDFGQILPETVSVVRWPASYIGSAQSYTDFEEVIADMEEDPIILSPLGDGDYIYEVTAHWGEAGYASYTFRTLPQIRGEQTDVPAAIFDALNELDYQPYTCDGLPQYRLTAADGTIYALNLSEKWVWRGNEEQAELPDELIAQLIVFLIR